MGIWTKIIVGLSFTASSFGQIDSLDINRIDRYLEFLSRNGPSAKDYVIEHLKKKDIVILAERYHQEETQYELISEILKDDFFIEHVGNIAVEIGGSNRSDELNSFLGTFEGTWEEGQGQLLKHQRDISFYPLWNKESYRVLLSTILKLNRILPKENKIDLYLCDREFDWSGVKSKEDWEKSTENNRDSILAKNISRSYERIREMGNKKLLVILNEAHAIANPKWIDPWQKRAAQYLTELYGAENISSILINSVGTNESDEDILLQNGYWDLAFELSDLDDVGFDFEGSPFGMDPFDYAHGKNNELFEYKDLFTGFVFYKGIENHRLSLGVNGIIDDGFKEEFFRRVGIYHGPGYLEELRNDEQLTGWDQIEYYSYDGLEDKLDRIQNMGTAYKSKKE